MRTIIPVCDGSSRYLIEAEPDETDGPDVLHIVEPYEYVVRRARLTSRGRGHRRRRVRS